jgi:hypothetical protein
VQASDDQGLSVAAIERVISRARRRIRSQWALEGATTAAILASAAALAIIFLIRVEAISRITGVGLLIGTVGIVAVGALLKAARRIDDERIARRIDRESNLSDRLSTAIAFTRVAMPAAPEHPETYDLMLAAIRDGVRAVPRADIARATPFVPPADLRAALGFLAISALAAGLAIPTVDRTPHLYRVDPDHGAAGDDVVLRGANLMTGITRPIAALRARDSLGAPNVPAEATSPSTSPPMMRGFVPADGAVFLGSGKAHPVVILDWAVDQIAIRIPESAPIGATTITAWIGDEAIGPLAFTVVDRKDSTYHKAGSVTLDPDDRAYLEAMLSELKTIAQRDKVPELEDFAKQIQDLLKDAELGKISKEKLLDSLAKAEEQLNKNAEPNQAEVDQQLGEMGKELSKEQITKELGDALQKQDLEKAQQELNKLADKLDNKELSEKDQEQLAKQLEKVAKQMEQKAQQQDQKVQQQKQKLEDEIRRLEKKKQEAKTEQDQLDAERKLDKKKDELKKLEKDQQDKDQSAQRQALKRLSRDLEKTAQDLKDNKTENKDGVEKQDQEKNGERPSQKLKDAARETGRVDQDRRKQSTQKKTSSQMDDLREAMRRAKQKGDKGPQDPFGKQGKNRDFAERARGGKGQGQSWKPGQQPGGGQKPGQQPGGTQPGNGKEWGTGHDSNLTGDATGVSGNTKDDDLQGVQGKNGGGTRETILAAAQKGFANKRYRDVYGKYHQIVEEVMRTEKLPSSYKYYVKRYFAKIHPSGAAPSAASEGAPSGASAPSPGGASAPSPSGAPAATGTATPGAPSPSQTEPAKDNKP